MMGDGFSFMQVKVGGFLFSRTLIETTLSQETLILLHPFVSSTLFYRDKKKEGESCVFCYWFVLFFLDLV
jgi:hypothetical protein